MIMAPSAENSASNGARLVSERVDRASRSRAAATCAALLVAAAICHPSGASAQDLEPRAYNNLPIGLNFLLGGYGYSTGGVATDPSLPIEDGKLTVHTALAAYARSFSVLGQSAKIDVIVPFSWISGTASLAGEPVSREVDGFNDPRFRFTWNFYGAPALSMEEFQSYQQDVIVGASVQVSPPLGQYDPTKLVNAGTNRWFVKPELGISKAWGPLILEVTPSVTFYTDNDNFLNGMTRSQDPLYAVQGHLVYNVTRGIWGALDTTYYFGGRTSVDGVEKDDRQENWRAGATLTLPVDRRHSIKLYGSTGVFTRTGANFDAVGILLQYRWGAGL
jgi:hypothetical protein